jgi:hypothetical protein
MKKEKEMQNWLSFSIACRGHWEAVLHWPSGILPTFIIIIIILIVIFIILDSLFFFLSINVVSVLFLVLFLLISAGMGIFFFFSNVLRVFGRRCRFAYT